jgi:hypothetical protein
VCLSRPQASIDVLLRYLASGCSSPSGLGSMSTCVYDTAWVAMISKVIDGRPQWLFSLSFEYLLVSQKADGGWGCETSDPIDAILNTMAALLAVKKHQSTPECNGMAESNLSDRLRRATSFLQKKLDTWDVEMTEHIGFEILVPAHLRLLADEGIPFAFPGLGALSRLNQQKLKDFSPKMLYSQLPSTLTHSLEAFVGKIDFDKVRHRLVFGSMMASPSSTAAYLIHASQWDDEAEAYIRSVLERGGGRGSGGVPNVFPVTIVELAWVFFSNPTVNVNPNAFPGHVNAHREWHFPKRRELAGPRCSDYIPREASQPSERCCWLWYEQCPGI